MPVTFNSNTKVSVTCASVDFVKYETFCLYFILTFAKQKSPERIVVDESYDRRSTLSTRDCPPGCRLHS